MDKQQVILRALNDSFVNELADLGKYISKDSNDPDAKMNYLIQCCNIINKISDNPSILDLASDKLNEYEREIDENESELSASKADRIDKGNKVRAIRNSIRRNKLLYRLEATRLIKKYVRNELASYEAARQLECGYKITNDNCEHILSEYKEYFKHIFSYQLKFAQRSEKLTTDQVVEYKYACEDEYVDKLIKEVNAMGRLKITFDYSPYNPLELNIAEFEVFTRNVTKLMTLLATTFKSSRDLAAIIDFQKDSTGRFKHRNDISKLFESWDRYLEAYDLSIQNQDYDEIYAKLHGDKCVSSRKKIVESYIDYAKLYIQAVENGKFPHIE